MRPLVSLVLAFVLFGGVTGCAAASRQAKSSVQSTCAESCKNQPADTQGQCIAECTK